VGESDTRVTGGALDHRAAGAEQAPFFGVADYVERGAVFDGAAGVGELGFAEDFAAGLLGEVVQADEGCVADGCGRMLECCLVGLGGEGVRGLRASC
jgi:hypothetical protein